ncbi:MAG: hypothetical protein Q7S14_02220 [bacterium]|nr:hypothetical protein [bacterium]
MIKFNEFIDVKTAVTSIIVFIFLVISSIAIFGLSILSDKPKSENPQINISTLTKETVESSKKQVEKLNYDTTLDILQGVPISTPPFVLDPDRLRNYLGKVSKTIYITGEIDDAYLYISTGHLDINKESIYFYIVDGKIAEGHLYPKEALSPVSENTFIYNLKNLPLVKFPYSLDRPTHLDHKDVVNTLFNRQDQNVERRYYVGAFVSTTQLPNEVNAMEIRYKCKQSSSCSITLQ